MTAFIHNRLQPRPDALAVERPLEIHVAGAKPFITMRTPGADMELVAGLMYGEGVVETRSDIVYSKRTPGPSDIMRLMLKRPARERLGHVERNMLATSACGVCGKPRFCEPPWPQASDGGFRVTPRQLLKLSQQLRCEQTVFARTGGLHAAGLFDAHGALVALREDVGRHNALDKLIGWALLNGCLPLRKHVVLLSGRASYELLQKSAMAGIAVVCAVSAPSSYAVEVARAHGITLIGFLRDDRFNIYSNGHRVASPATRQANNCRAL